MVGIRLNREEEEMPAEPFLDSTDWNEAAKSLDMATTSTRGFSVQKHLATQIEKYARKHGHNIKIGLPTADVLDEWLSKQWKLVTLAQFGGIKSLDAFNRLVATRYWAKHDDVNDGIMWRNHYAVYRDRDFHATARRKKLEAQHEMIEERLQRVKDKQVDVKTKHNPKEPITMDQDHTEDRVHASKLAND